LKVDLNRPLRDIETDEDITYTDKQQEQKAFTAALACIRALMQVFKGEEDLSGEQKLNRYNLASRIKSANKRSTLVHLMVEEIAEIKKVVTKYYGPIIVGQVFPMLEGDIAEEKESVDLKAVDVPIRNTKEIAK
jgi:hypothetical protein